MNLKSIQLILSKFHEKNGHSNAQKRVDKIGAWVQVQRKKYRLKQLSIKQIKRLESLDIDWDPIESLWQKKYRELTEYFQKNGHTSISGDYLPLQSWIGKQRIYYKLNKLSGISKAF